MSSYCRERRSRTYGCSYQHCYRRGSCPPHRYYSSLNNSWNAATCYGKKGASYLSILLSSGLARHRNRGMYRGCQEGRSLGIPATARNLRSITFGDLINLSNLLPLRKCRHFHNISYAKKVYPVTAETKKEGRRLSRDLRDRPKRPFYQRSGTVYLS